MRGEGGRLGVSVFETLTHNLTQPAYDRIVFYLFILVSGCGLTVWNMCDPDFHQNRYLPLANKILSIACLWLH
jgi:hypothetical protein